MAFRKQVKVQRACIEVTIQEALPAIAEAIGLDSLKGALIGYVSLK